MKKQKFLFGDFVVVNEDLIGIIVKTYCNIRNCKYNYDVYVREFNRVENYPEDRIQRYAVRHKYLNSEELEYQKKYESGDIL